MLPPFCTDFLTTASSPNQTVSSLRAALVDSSRMSIPGTVFRDGPVMYRTAMSSPSKRIYILERSVSLVPEDLLDNHEAKKRQIRYLRYTIDKSHNYDAQFCYYLFFHIGLFIDHPARSSADCKHDKKTCSHEQDPGTVNEISVYYHYMDELFMIRSSTASSCPKSQAEKRYPYVQ